jgi:hypothetical protein
MVWLGRLLPEDMDGDGHISDMEAKKLSANFSRIIQGWARDRRLTLTDAMARVLENYDSGDDIRQKTLKSVIAGLDVWSGEQLNQELPALGFSSFQEYVEWRIIGDHSMSIKNQKLG